MATLQTGATVQYCKEAPEGVDCPNVEKYSINTAEQQLSHLHGNILFFFSQQPN